MIWQYLCTCISTSSVFATNCTKQTVSVGEGLCALPLHFRKQIFAGGGRTVSYPSVGVVALDDPSPQGAKSLPCVRGGGENLRFSSEGLRIATGANAHAIHTQKCIAMNESTATKHHVFASRNAAWQTVTPEVLRITNTLKKNGSPRPVCNWSRNDVRGR